MLCGAQIRVEDADELAGALKRALEYDGPALLEIHSDAQLVYSASATRRTACSKVEGSSAG